MEPIEGRLARQIAFLVECDQLKEVLRQTINIHSRRRENDAEHSWALCLFVITLAEYSNEPVDVLRVVEMLVIHDLVEIDAGDTFAYDAAGMATQRARESAGADRIFGMLPDDQAVRFRKLWDEFEARNTPEARFAAAIDRLQPMLLNCLTEGETWRGHDVTLGQVTARNAHIAKGSQALWGHIRSLVDELVRAGHLRE